MIATYAYAECHWVFSNAEFAEFAEFAATQRAAENSLARSL